MDEPTLHDVNNRVTIIENERLVEAVERKNSDTATKQDIKELSDRFDGLIKAIWTVAGMLATAGLAILANHL